MTKNNLYHKYSWILLVLFVVTSLLVVNNLDSITGQAVVDTSNFSVNDTINQSINQSVDESQAIIPEEEVLESSQEPIPPMSTSGIDNPPLSAQGTVCDVFCNSCSDCNTKLSSNTFVCLNTSIIDYSSTCITIPGNNKVFDCLGYAVDGNNNVNSWNYGIFLSGRSNVTVKNCLVTDWTHSSEPSMAGISVGGSSNCLILNNTVSNNKWGIFFNSGGSGNDIINNTVINSTELGIYCANGVNSNDYYGNNITGGAAGINLQDCDTSRIFNNTIYENSGIAIYMNSQSDNNNISDNTGYSNDKGIYLHTTTGNLVIDNNLSESLSYDFFVFGTADSHCVNTIVNNTGSGNREIKFVNSQTTLSNEVFSELILCNADNSVIDNISIVGSDVRNNMIEVFRTDYSNFSNINSSFGHVGFYVQESNNNNFSDNFADYNDQTGLRFYDSSNNIIVNNSANYNKFNGLYFYSTSTGNTAFNNTVCFNNVSEETYFDIQDLDSNSGDDNTCNFTDNWNDTGTVGCSFPCFEVSNLPSTAEFSTSFGSTDFSTVPDITNVSNLTLAAANGSIRFPVGYYVDAELEDYDSFVEIGDNFVSVDSSSLDSSFNSSANITINYVNCPQTVYYDSGFFGSSGEIISQGQVCNSSTDPACTIFSCDENLTFSVSHFTGYASIGSANLTVWDETDSGMPFADQIKYPDELIAFFANYTNASDSITDADCFINFTDSSAVMVWNATTNIYWFNRTFSTTGIFDYNVSCNKTDFESLTANDTVTVSTNFSLSSCANITVPGNYNLTGNITDSSISGCINISASNVTLDCQNNIIDGDDSASYGIYSYGSYTNITIRDCTVTDWVTGIYWRNIQDSLIERVNVTSSPGYGIYLYFSDTNVIRDSFVTYSSTNAIRIEQGSHNQIINCTVSDNPTYGIAMYADTDITVTNCTIKSNAYGFFLSSNTDLSIYNNFLNNTNQIYWSGGNTIDWNTSLTLGTSIANTSYIGGNYWAQINGSGFSESCTDLDQNNICDSSYSLAAGNIDYLPLTNLGLPSASVSLVYPVQNINVTENEFFNFSVNASCSVANCNLVNVSLDPFIVWLNQTYGGSSDDIGRTILELSDGSLVTAGTTASFGLGGNDFWLIKTDEDGVEIWNTTYGGAASDVVYSMVQVSDGFVMAGSSASFGPGGDDFWIVKFNNSGEYVWNSTFGGSGSDIAHNIIQTSDGGFALSGYTMSFGVAVRDMWIIKTNSTGGYLWNSTFGSTGIDESYGLTETSSGDIVASGYSNSFGNNFQGWVVKMDSSGNHVWNNTYGGSSDEDFEWINSTSDGGFIATGYTKTYTVGGLEDHWIVKLNSSGGQEWRYVSGRSGADVGKCVFETSDGGFISVAASQLASGSGQHDYYVVKLNSSGNLSWSYTTNGSLQDFPYYIFESDDSYFITGVSESFGAGNDDVWNLEISESKGLISTTTGDTPFYTNGTNPFTVNLSKDESEIVTWFVNATGVVGSSWEFFAFTELVDNTSISSESSKINISIQSAADITPPTVSNQVNYTTDNLNYTFQAESDETGNCSLWGNWSGAWAVNETKTVTAATAFNFTSITFAGDDSTYLWNVWCNDSADNEDWGTNYSFPTADLINPTVSNQVNYTTDNLNYTFQAESNEDGYCTLWGNWSGTWTANETTTVTANTAFNFTQINFTIYDSSYLWNVLCNDSSDNTAWGTNFSFTTASAPTCGCNNGTFNYTCGDSIRESCVMNCDLNSSGKCFTVGVPNLVLDGNGFNITGNSAGEGIKLTNAHNTTVKNFRVYNFGFGIYDVSSTGLNISNNTLVNHSQKAIRFTLSNNCSINNNNISTGIGIFILWGGDHNISNNFISYVSTGITSSSSVNNFVSSNDVCFNNLDFSFDSLVSGVSNTCDLPGSFNDSGSVGCSNVCPGTCSSFQSQIDSPVAGQNYSGTININVSTDASYVDNVTYTILNSSDPDVYSSYLSPSWVDSWNSSSVSDGVYNISSTVIVADNCNLSNVSIFNVNNTDITLPTVSNQVNYTTDNLSFIFQAESSKDANCTLWGNWSGSWSVNETTAVTANTAFNFTQINFTADGSTYLWNVNCTDSFGNIGWGTNYSFNVSLCTDADNDSYFVEGGSCGPLDCDDSDATKYPGAPCTRAGYTGSTYDANCVCSGGTAEGGGGGGGGDPPAEEPPEEPPVEEPVEEPPAVEPEIVDTTPEGEVVGELSSEQVSAIRGSSSLSYTPRIKYARSLSSANLTLNFTNTGDQTLKNLKVVVEQPAEKVKADIMHPRKIWGWDLLAMTGWITSGNVRDPKFLSWQVSDPKFYDKLAPGESIDLDLGVIAPLGREEVQELTLKILSFGNVIYEEVISVEVNTTEFLVVADVNKEDNLVDLYMVVSNLKGHDSQYAVEFNINSFPDSGKKKSFFKSLFDNPTTLIAEYYGPYHIKSEDTRLFAYQYEYSDEFVGDHHIKYIVWEEPSHEKITMASGELNLSMQGEN